MKDIATYQDCIKLIEKFYEKLLIDPQIKHFFVNLDLSKHIPKVADFWAFVLIDKLGYNNNMMNAHAHLDLKAEDYTRWLDLFHQTIDENFSGEKAQMAKDRSFGIGMTMKYALSKKP